MRPVAVELARTSRAQLLDVHCGLGPRDRPYPERHTGWTIALVRDGSFAYHASDTPRSGRELRPGWIMIGRDGAEFECRHPHTTGDDCTSIHVAQELVEDVRRALHLRGDRRLLPSAVLPPVPRVDAELHHRPADLDHAAVAVVQAVLEASGATPPGARAPSRADEDKVRAALDALDASPHEPWPLGDLAALVGASPFHFARAFRALVGTTPHRYLVAARLRRAAALLRDTDARITDVALDAGFADLSNFVHSFRRALGTTPSAFRTRGAGTRARSAPSRPRPAPRGTHG